MVACDGQWLVAPTLARTGRMLGKPNGESFHAIFVSSRFLPDLSPISVPLRRQDVVALIIFAGPDRD
jgi:hypothetical protein